MIRRAALIGLSLLLSVPGLAAEYTVVVHPGVPVHSLSAAELRRILTRQTDTWPGDIPIQILLPPPESEAMTWLAEDVLETHAALLKRYLMEKAYRSGQPALSTADDLTQARQWASQTPGAITILSTSQSAPDISPVDIAP